MKRIIFLMALSFASLSLLAQPEAVTYEPQIVVDTLPVPHVVDTLSPSYEFVGKTTEDNTNQLWLHGYQGAYLTSGNEPNLDIVAYYTRAQGNFVFRSDVAAQSFYTLSDTKLKTNIKSLGNSLLRLQQVSGVSYSLSYDALKDINRIKNRTAKLSKENVLADVEIQLEKKRRKECEQQRIGFVAQDLQRVFPELVKTDSSGFLYVDNMGLIPVIVEALKEQQSQIEQQQQQIDEQKEQIESLMKLLGEARQVMLTKK
jgi:hypothetical protein